MIAPLAVSTAIFVFIAIPLAVVWFVGVVDIVRRDVPASHKVAWIAVVLLLPFVGTLAYFLLRKPTDDEIRLAQSAAAERRSR